MPRDPQGEAEARLRPLQGTYQGQINEKAGFTFAKGLRAVLRQDPDVILRVGEHDPVA